MKTPVDHNSLESYEEYCVVGVPGKVGFLAHTDHKVFYEEASLVKLMKKNDFSPVKLFYAPFKLEYFSENWGAYCFYGVF